MSPVLENYKRGGRGDTPEKLVTPTTSTLVQGNTSNRIIYWI
jgi:hypothetical protein